MKLKIAFRHTLLAAICAASHARAHAASHLRDPRTVEEKEQVHRQTMGDHFLPSLSGVLAGDSNCGNLLAQAEAKFGMDFDISVEEAKSLACSAVSDDFEVCRGCQGYSQVGREVHIPGCVEMTLDQCMEFAKAIVGDKPDWFKNGADAQLFSEEYDVNLPSEMTYYKLGLPVMAKSEVDPNDGSRFVTGVAGDCMVQYPWDWCVPSSSNGDTVCLKLQPWDCSAAVGEAGCLSTYKCCAKIQDGGYPKPDINGNELQCYEWELPVKSSDSSGISDGNTIPGGNSGISGSGGVTGNRVVIHVSDGKVALPAVITDDNHEVTHNEEIIETQQVCPKSFPDLATLKAAVALYVSQDCAIDSNSNCLIGQEWGHPINSWCVEEVTSFSSLFSSMQTFNEDINGWTTSQVTIMTYTFFNAKAFNQPLDNWDVSSVTKMVETFDNANAFNQPLDNWDVSHVTSMSRMFQMAIAFNQPLNNWDVSSTINMFSLFSNARAFNQPLNNWDVSSVETMRYMFANAHAFNQPLNNWNVSKLIVMGGLFRHARAFNQPLDKWDLSSVTKMSSYAADSVFDQASAFNQNLCRWGDHFTSELDYDMMFYGTSCPNTGDPTSARGPWCQGYC